jgi:glycosyltransferase involved in cell wall biosynthesis
MRLLVVTYYYPPWAFPGANRWASMTKHLRRLGHEVTVVTTVAPVLFGGGSDGPDARDGVVRTADLNASPLLRKLLRRPPAAGLPSAAATAAGAATPPALLTKVIVPDAYLVGWNPWTLRAIGGLLRERQIDCLITSGPPDSTHLLGLGLRRRRPAWIADFRDGWLFEPLREPFPTAPQRALERWFERQVATRADAVVAVTSPIVEDFRSRLRVPAELIANGWDPDADVAPEAPALLDPDKFTFLHTGTTSGPRGRDPRPLLAALRRMLDDDPALGDRVEVVFAGLASADDLKLLGDPRLRSLVRYVGQLSRDVVFALQRNAGALLLLTSSHKSEATGKLFEYLGSGRPIVALAQGNEAARIVEQTGTGVCVSPRDVDAIVVALRRAIESELERGYSPRELQRYRYPGPAAQMADLAERVVSARSARHRVQ